MKRHIMFLCAAGFGIFSTSAFAELPAPVEAPELIALRETYRAQVATAAESVQTRYKAKLQEMIKLQTQKGDLGAAIATRNELKSLEASGGASPAPAASGIPSPAGEIKLAPIIAQTLLWQQVNGSATMEFAASGEWNEKWNGQVKKGRWKAIAPDTVQVEDINGNKVDWVYQLQKDGETFRRCHDNTWFRKAPADALAKPTPASTPPSPSGPSSKDLNPFGRVAK